MGIWKWMKNTAYSPLTLVPLKKPAQTSRCRVGLPFVRGDRSSPIPPMVSALCPAYYIPLGDSLLQSGFGSSAKFDFLPVSYFGLFVEGEYLSIGLKNVDAIPVMGGSLGGSYLLNPKERLTIRTDLMGGIYSIKRSGLNLSGISAGADVSATFSDHSRSQRVAPGRLQVLRVPARSFHERGAHRSQHDRQPFRRRSAANLRSRL